MWDWLLQYKYIILFYLVIIIFLYVKRKQLATQAKFIILYRTTWGLKWIERFSQKYREWVTLVGYIGVGGGFIGLAVISYTLLKGLYDVLVHPVTTNTVSLVLPGIKVPGFGVLSFVYWIIAIFVIAGIHEFSHGIVARAHNIKVKNTGLVFLGPIIGAFVEPEEEKLQKEKDVVQYSVYAAGAFSNIILAVIVILLLNIVFTPLQQAMTEPAGFTFDSYYNTSYPAEKAGLAPGMIVTGVNNIPTTEFQRFSDQLTCSKPGEIVTLQTKEKNYAVTLTANPSNTQRGFLGISEIHNEVELKKKYSSGFWSVFYNALNWWNGFLRWLFLLSLGIGLFNLLPLPIVDGGRMTQTFLHRLKGQEKGERHYRQISLFFLLVLVLNLALPYLSKLF